MRIALDFDGTIGNTLMAWLNEYNEKYNDNKPYSAIDAWHFHEKFGLNIEQSMEVFGACWNKAIDKITPTERNIGKKIDKLWNYGDIDLVTAVPKKYFPQIEEWLFYHQVRFGKIVYSHNKEETFYDAFIDDKPELLHRAKPRPVFLKSQRWNRLENAQYRFRSFSEVPKLLNKWQGSL